MIWLWIGFLLLVFIFLALDLGVFNRHAHVISVKEALRWTGVWIVMALLFNVLVYFIYENHWFGMQGFIHVLEDGKMVYKPATGMQMALQFLTGYIIEKSLSMDNIFVIAVIFGYFKVPAMYQHRVLFWGILGALIMRGAMIALGAVMIKSFSWTIYIFGGLLIVTAIRMLMSGDDHGDPNHNWLTRLARKIYPVADEYDGQKFFTVVNGRKAITKLMLVLLVVESTDVLFAVDSIPAIFAVTEDPFIVFTSNVFAILGLRSLYFALAGMIDKFRYLKPSLVFVLAFVGVKMIVSHHYPLPTWISLSVIVGILFVGIVASLLAPPKPHEPGEPAKIDMSEEKETAPPQQRND